MALEYFQQQVSLNTPSYPEQKKGVFEMWFLPRETIEKIGPLYFIVSPSLNWPFWLGFRLSLGLGLGQWVPRV